MSSTASAITSIAPEIEMIMMKQQGALQYFALRFVSAGSSCGNQYTHLTFQLDFHIAGKCH
jgi:hypothetical protein